MDRSWHRSLLPVGKRDLSGEVGAHAPRSGLAAASIAMDWICTRNPCPEPASKAGASSDPNLGPAGADLEGLLRWPLLNSSGGGDARDRQGLNMGLHLILIILAILC